MHFFEARPSLIQNSGQGLYALRDIPKHSYFSVNSIKARKAGCFVLPLYVKEGTDMTSWCVFSGKVMQLSDMRIDNNTPKYSYVDKDFLLMKANDFAWKPNIDSIDYYLNENNNKLSFVLNYNESECTGIVALALDDITAGNEIGVTYGYDYWKPPHVPYTDMSYNTLF